MGVQKLQYNGKGKFLKLFVWKKLLAYSVRCLLKRFICIHEYILQFSNYFFNKTVIIFNQRLYVDLYSKALSFSVQQINIFMWFTFVFILRQSTYFVIRNIYELQVQFFFWLFEWSAVSVLFSLAQNKFLWYCKFWTITKRKLNI